MDTVKKYVYISCCYDIIITQLLFFSIFFCNFYFIFQNSFFLLISNHFTDYLLFLSSLFEIIFVNSISRSYSYLLFLYKTFVLFLDFSFPHCVYISLWIMWIILCITLFVGFLLLILCGHLYSSIHIFFIILALLFFFCIFCINVYFIFLFTS